jgi:hypothetical protein
MSTARNFLAFLFVLPGTAQSLHRLDHGLEKQESGLNFSISSFRSVYGARSVSYRMGFGRSVLEDKAAKA